MKGGGVVGRKEKFIKKCMYHPFYCLNMKVCMIVLAVVL